MLQKGYKQKQIAEAIGKDKSTVCREIRRNCDARSGAYRYELAQRKCEKRHQTKPKKIHFTEQVKAYVDTLLKNDFSPEQIAGRAKSKNVECVSHERIYQYVWDGEGRPLYLRNQMIVKFHPDLVNTEVVDNRNIQSGIISEFINPLALELIIESGYFNEEIANLSIKKIHHNMTTSETTTITRIGEEMEIPKFWSTFLIEWSSIAGMSFEAALDTLNTLWPLVEHAHPNYIYQ
jgi:hypothetical protein